MKGERRGGGGDGGGSVRGGLALVLSRLFLMCVILLLVLSWLPSATASDGGTRGRGLKCYQCYASTGQDSADMMCADKDGKALLGREKDCEHDEQGGCLIQTFKDKKTVFARDCVPLGNGEGLVFEEGCHDGTAFEGKGDKEGVYCFCKTEMCNKELPGPSQSSSSTNTSQSTSTSSVSTIFSSSVIRILITFGLGVYLRY